MTRLHAVRHRLVRLLQELRALSDWTSRRRMLALRLEQALLGEIEAPLAESAVGLRVKALDGRLLFLRRRSSDIEMLWDTVVAGWSLPPAEAGGDLRRIVELGTNVGAGLSALAARYPHASLRGVEPDPENAKVARRNLLWLGGRASVVQAAIWDSDTNLVVDRSHRAWGLVVRPREPGDPESWPNVPAQTVGAVLEDFEPGEPIDFLFMDIEGTEGRVLGAGDVAWADRVRAIRVESEYEYGGEPDVCAAALEALGFRTRIEHHSWGAVFGVRADQR